MTVPTLLRSFLEKKLCPKFIKKSQKFHFLWGSTLYLEYNRIPIIYDLFSYVEKSVAGGAKLVFGGKRVEGQGLFFYPTVLTDVEEENYAANNESFGPVMIISRFSERDVDDVIERANRTEYGLAGGVFSKDTSRAMRVARRIKAGTVFINTYQKTDVAA
jgi:formyltetrahydrofolate dehydrogenase